MIHISLIIVARRPVYVRLALWFLHHPAWVKGHTGGSRLTPTVYPCPVQLERLWVAYVVQEPNEPQQHAQLAQMNLNNETEIPEDHLEEYAFKTECKRFCMSIKGKSKTTKQIVERSGRPEITHDVISGQDERKTSRSLEIDVNSFREELGSSQRTERPVTGKPVMRRV